MRPIPEPILTAMKEHRRWYESQIKQIPKEGSQLVLDEVDLSEMDFSSFALFDAWFLEVNFDNCRLVGTDFYWATLPSSTFRNADMTDCNLGKTNIDYTDFSGATMVNANLVSASCWESDLTGAHLTNANLPRTSFYNTKLVAVNFTNAMIGGCLFDNVDLSDAILTNVRELDEAHIRSIVVHGKRLGPDEARQWMKSQIGRGSGVS